MSNQLPDYCPPDPAMAERWRRVLDAMGVPVVRGRAFLTFAVHEDLLSDEHRFHITTAVQTPGYSATERWVVLQQGANLELRELVHS
jgi:hypothetical protein